MRYAQVKCGNKTLRLELLTVAEKTGPSGEKITVVTGYKVDKNGDYIGGADVNDIQVVIGAASISELDICCRYGELLPIDKCEKPA